MSVPAAPLFMKGMIQMRTSKPVAAISYNTFNFLKRSLDELMLNGTIDYWAFIKHFPEAGEDETKEQFHVYVSPSHMIETKDLWKVFDEIDTVHPELGALKCIPDPRKEHSDFANWLLYVIHDEEYLASKGLTREYHYTLDEVVTSDRAELQWRNNAIDRPALCGGVKRNVQEILGGATPAELMVEGKVHPREYNAYRSFSRDVYGEATTNDLRRDINSLTQQMAEIEKEKNALETEKTALESENNALGTENAALEEERNALVKENATLESQLATYRCLFGDLGPDFDPDEKTPEEYAIDEIGDFWADQDHPENFYDYWPPDAEYTPEELGLKNIRQEYTKAAMAANEANEKARDLPTDPEPDIDLDIDIENFDFPFQ